MSLWNSVFDGLTNLEALGRLAAAVTMLSFMITAESLMLVVWTRVRRRRRSGGRFYWADILLPPKVQRDLDANLDDMMPIWVKAYGQRRARRIRRWQVLRVVTGHWLTPLWLAFVKVLELVRGK